ncbi:MAG: hypothetical protein M1821_006797 [Bathelium mastoideum]|nr:MAG: hypothetical protein M1821_006797 [Bathelium mastoideum]
MVVLVAALAPEEVGQFEGQTLDQALGQPLGHDEVHWLGIAEGQALQGRAVFPIPTHGPPKAAGPQPPAPNPPHPPGPTPEGNTEANAEEKADEQPDGTLLVATMPPLAQSTAPEQDFGKAVSVAQNELQSLLNELAMLLRSLEAAVPPGRKPFQPEREDHCDGQAYGQLPVVTEGPEVMVDPSDTTVVAGVLENSLGVLPEKTLSKALEKSLGAPLIPPFGPPN